MHVMHYVMHYVMQYNICYGRAEPTEPTEPSGAERSRAEPSGAERPVFEWFERGVELGALLFL